jgi:flagellin
MSNMVVRTNILAINAHRNLGMVGNSQTRASARLSSGFRINSAADDAAGLSISESMRAQIRGMRQASRNAQDGISLIQTTEGYTSTITEILQRARELIVQAANDTYSTENRQVMFNEVAQLAQEVHRIWTSATFNGDNLFHSGPMGVPYADPDNPAGGPADAGSFDGAREGRFSQDEFSLQVGPNRDDFLDVNVRETIDVVHRQIFDMLQIFFYDFNPASSVTGDFSQVRDISDPFGDGSEAWDNAAAIRGLLSTPAGGGLDHFLITVSDLRAALGAYQNRIEFTVQNLDISAENLSASESRIRDADMAAEMMALTQANILQQAATAMLAQANQAPQSVLQLLQ